MSNGKGSKPRKFSVSLDKFGQNYDDIFRKNDKMNTEKTVKKEDTQEEKRIKIAEACGWKRYIGPKTILYQWAPGHINPVIPFWYKGEEESSGELISPAIELPDYFF